MLLFGDFKKRFGVLERLLLFGDLFGVLFADFSSVLLLGDFDLLTLGVCGTNTI